MASALLGLLFVVLVLVVKGDEELKDFEFIASDDDEMMIAQESRQYKTIVKAPIKIIKPNGVTNSHRPQYNIDSFEAEEMADTLETTTKGLKAKDYKQTYKIRNKEGIIRNAVLRAMEKKDHLGEFAQVLPIIRAMSGTQRGALASLVASHVTTPRGRTPLNLSQVRSMFGETTNLTSDLMLPILLDMANLIRRAGRSGKEPRDVKQPAPSQLIKRSLSLDETELDDEPFETYDTLDTKHIDTTTASTTITQKVIQLSRHRLNPQRKVQNHTEVINNKNVHTLNHNRTEITDTKQINTRENLENITLNTIEQDKIKTAIIPVSVVYNKETQNQNSTIKNVDENLTSDLTADSTNQSLAQGLPVAEKLRSLNRFVDRKGNLIRRGTFPTKPPISTLARRTTPESSLNAVSRKRLPPRKPLTTYSSAEANCELFTNTLCLYSTDYPTEAIVLSIKRNKAAAGALLAEFKNPGEGAVDGVTADEEANYTTDQYLISNRREDGANREFAGAGEAGFMCPSTVKYARPQRARATSGQWKYIVNTGEHTQTLRLEKCLKPKESCTYLTDNFKSKCVQVYNYHRLLTWDHQNGLHMDIFKVPTCCSCHIEGYSVSFPPLGHRTQDTSSEQLSDEGLSSEHRNHAFESVQSSVQRPTVTKQTNSKLREEFTSFSPDYNSIPAESPFTKTKIKNNDLNFANLPSLGPLDSYGNSYFPDSFDQESSIRNVRRPSGQSRPTSSLDSVTLPSYLEPPTPAMPSPFSFVRENSIKNKTNNTLRKGYRPNRRPLRKKISGGLEDLVSAGTSAVEDIDIPKESNINVEESGFKNANIKINPPKRVTIAPKLQSAMEDITSTTFKPHEHNSLSNKNGTYNTKKINYNYHPIIDFFDGGDKEIESDDSIDREDFESSFIHSPGSEWKPINRPPSNNIAERKKHK